MKPFSILTSFVAIFVVGPVLGGDTALEKQLKELQGLWRIKEVRVHANGNKNPGDFFQTKWHWSIKGNKLTWKVPEQKDKEETITLSTRGKLRFIDLTNTLVGPDGKLPEWAKGRNWTLYGIYEADQDTLTVCFPIEQAGSNLRPVEITGAEGSGCMIWLLERVEKKQ